MLNPATKLAFSHVLRKLGILRKLRLNVPKRAILAIYYASMDKIIFFLNYNGAILKCYLLCLNFFYFYMNFFTKIGRLKTSCIRSLAHVMK